MAPLFGGLFRYTPGGDFHVKITDEAFQEAREEYTGNKELQKAYEDIVKEAGLMKYSAYDFPVPEIVGTILTAYDIQEEKNGLPSELRRQNMQLGRKDQVECENLMKKYQETIIQPQQQYEKKDAQAMRGELSRGFADRLMDRAGVLARRTIGNAIAKGVTGKTYDVRLFHDVFTEYICGSSPMATEYLESFAKEFGGEDEGITAVASFLRDTMLQAEAARKNRSGGR